MENSPIFSSHRYFQSESKHGHLLEKIIIFFINKVKKNPYYIYGTSLCKYIHTHTYIVGKLIKIFMFSLRIYP